MKRNVWAIVLAGGDGRRLESVTRDASGRTVPKQYFHLGGGPTLIARTLERALRVVPRERVLSVVARGHREWWEQELGGLPPENVAVQPRNCGTAVGIVFALLHVLRRDPGAIVLMVPSDHYVEDEDTMVRALEMAANEVNNHPEEVLLLGVTADHPDTEYGWVTPGKAIDSNVFFVDAFVEKPNLETAERLHGEGALWNSFLFVAVGDTLLDVCRKRLPDVVEALRGAVESPETQDAVYAQLGTHDFSREILQTFPVRLRLMRVPMCGWTDLGTPARFVSVHERVTR